MICVANRWHCCDVTRKVSVAPILSWYHFTIFFNLCKKSLGRMSWKVSKHVTWMCNGNSLIVGIYPAASARRHVIWICTVCMYIEEAIAMVMAMAMARVRAYRYTYSESESEGTLIHIKFHLRVSNLQMSCNDLTKMKGYHDINKWPTGRHILFWASCEMTGMNGLLYFSMFIAYCICSVRAHLCIF